MEQTINLETQKLDQNLNPITPQKNIFKILFFIFFSFFVIAIVILINILLTKNFQTTKPVTSTAPVIVTPTRIEKSPITSQTAMSSNQISNNTQNWQIYNFPFTDSSIKYPSNWMVKIVDNSLCLFSDSLNIFCDIAISRSPFSQSFDNPSKKTFEEIMAEDIKNSSTYDYTKAININGINAYEKQNSYPTYRIYFTNNGEIYTIYFTPGSSKPNENDLQWKIINTLKLK